MKINTLVAAVIYLGSCVNPCLASEELGASSRVADAVERIRKNFKETKNQIKVADDAFESEQTIEPLTVDAIDLASFFDPKRFSDEQRQALVEQLKINAEAIGFFTIKGHCVPESLVEKVSVKISQ